MPVQSLLPQSPRPRLLLKLRLLQSPPLRHL
jgi:hypothetical protein